MHFIEIDSDRDVLTEIWVNLQWYTCTKCMIMYNKSYVWAHYTMMYKYNNIYAQWCGMIYSDMYMYIDNHAMMRIMQWWQWYAISVIDSDLIDVEKLIWQRCTFHETLIQLQDYEQWK